MVCPLVNNYAQRGEGIRPTNGATDLALLEERFVLVNKQMLCVRGISDLGLEENGKERHQKSNNVGQGKAKYSWKTVRVICLSSRLDLCTCSHTMVFSKTYNPACNLYLLNRGLCLDPL